MGFLSKASTKEFALYFEGLPVWLLSLERTLASKVYICGCASGSELIQYLVTNQIDPLLITKAVARLGLSRLVYLGLESPPKEAIKLISGDIPYLISEARRLGSSTALYLSSTSLSKSHTGLPKLVDWHRYRHASFGGCTTFTALLGVGGLVNYSPVVTSIRRTLGHVLDHGTKPNPVTKASDFDHTMLSVDSRLNPESFDQEIRYPTSFYANGIGTRKLTTDEIGLAFGLPSWLRTGKLEKAHFPVVPLQIIDGCLNGLFSESVIRQKEMLETPLIRPLRVKSTSSWIPGLKRYLPKSWMNSETTSSKATKRDDAGIPTHMWDQRILLLWPWIGIFITFLRQRLMFVILRRLYLEFKVFMDKTHGINWSQKLNLLRRSRRKQREQGGRVEHSETNREDKEQPRKPNSANEELLRDAEVGVSILNNWGDADWWTWKGGSTLIFWRWPEGSQRKAARDGMDPWISGKLPNFKRKSRPPPSERRSSIWSKFDKFLRRGYVRLIGNIKSLTEYFHVPKGDDIRIVFNGTSCLLNRVSWAPNFWLPTSRSATRVLDFDYKTVDIDLGEMFVNFPLAEIFQEFSGIDLSPFKDEIHDMYGMEKDPRKETEVCWGRWERCWMGFRPSPFYAIRFFYWAEEFVRGNRNSSSNPLRWDIIKLNLPGSPEFDPTFPEVMKWDTRYDRIAGDLVAFVDDLRISGYSEEHAWGIARRVASRLQYLGIQDAPRKRRVDGGAWAGAIMTTSGGRITKTVSDDKWEKAKRYIDIILKRFAEEEDPSFDYKSLEQIRGFLCHLSMTFDPITPLLKGLHLTLAAHVPGRNEEGWKLSDNAWIAFVHARIAEGSMSDQDGEAALHPPEYDPKNVPKSVKGVARLMQDFTSLQEVFEAPKPPLVTVRALTVYHILYGFGDASGKGFGSTMLSKKGTRFRIGTWDADTEEESSNFREFENIVETLETEEKDRNLCDSLVYLFTDNSTVESAIYKGNSSSKKLFDLVLRLKKLEMRTGAALNIIHVSGKRMMAQGTDGVSRGSMKEGITTGASMLSFVPISISAMDVFPPLGDWISSWAGGSEVEFLSPEGWFERGHDHLGGEFDSRGFWHHRIVSGTFVWSPPPAAAEAALEELRKTRTKRQDSLHVFVVPHLMTPQWLKQLYKASDIVFHIPAGCPYWPETMYESLTIGLSLPFLSSRPWQLRRTPKVLNVGRSLRRMFKEEPMAAGDLLRKFLLECRRLRSLPELVVRRVLFFEPSGKIPHQEGPKRGGRRKRKRSSGPGKTDPGVGEESAGGLGLLPRKKRRPHPHPV